MITSHDRLKVPNRRGRALLVLPAAAGLAALAACSSTSSSSSSAPSSAPASSAAAGSGTSASGAAAATAEGLKTASIGGVTVLTNAKGFTLFSFAPDTATKSACNGACATAWPPQAAPATVTSPYTTITRPTARPSSSSTGTRCTPLSPTPPRGLPAATASTHSAGCGTKSRHPVAQRAALPRRAPAAEVTERAERDGNPGALGAWPAADHPARSGVGLLIATAAIHLDLYLTGYRTIPTIGWLFLLQVIVAFALGLAVLVIPGRLVLPSRLAAAAGAGFALSTLGGYLLTVWIGLFGFKEVRTTAGIAAGVVEVVAFVVLAALALAPAPQARDGAGTGGRRTCGTGGVPRSDPRRRSPGRPG